MPVNLFLLALKQFNFINHTTYVQSDISVHSHSQEYFCRNNLLSLFIFCKHKITINYFSEKKCSPNCKHIYVCVYVRGHIQYFYIHVHIQIPLFLSLLSLYSLFSLPFSPATKERLPFWQSTNDIRFLYLF